MAHRQVSILSKAAEEVASIAYFIESHGMPATAKKFVEEYFFFFEKLGHPKLKHRPRKYEVWEVQGFRCANFRRKYVVAYLDSEDEVVICDFAPQKSLV